MGISDHKLYKLGKYQGSKKFKLYRRYFGSMSSYNPINWLLVKKVLCTKKEAKTVLDSQALMIRMKRGSTESKLTVMIINS